MKRRVLDSCSDDDDNGDDDVHDIDSELELSGDVESDCDVFGTQLQAEDDIIAISDIDTDNEDASGYDDIQEVSNSLCGADSAPLLSPIRNPDDNLRTSQRSERLQTHGTAAPVSGASNADAALHGPLTAAENSLGIIELALRKVFGLDDFRGQQKDVIESALRDEDQLVLMPTGGGKSLCYQLPAVLARGVTVVVTPLISLMHDQLTALLTKPCGGIPAAYISSQMSVEAKRQLVCDLTRTLPTCKLLYATPEQLLQNTGLQDILKKLHDRGMLARVVVDEAHCISTWGQDFRKDYKELHELKKLFPKTPTMALTATATEGVIRDIKRDLAIPRCRLFKASFFRSNLSIRICQKDNDSDEVLVAYLRTLPSSGSGIVYCISKKECERVAEGLKDEDIKAAHYHAGMTAAQRRRAQASWQAGDVQVIVATIAFGMGIDKPNVRFVVHYCMPGSIQGYFQEIGRAGRDGERSECVLFYAARDVSTLKYLAQRSPGSRKRNRERIDQMEAYCLAKQGCRHASLLALFDDTLPGGSCGTMCDHCLSQRHPILPEQPGLKGAKKQPKSRKAPNPSARAPGRQQRKGKTAQPRRANKKAKHRARSDA